MSKIQKITGNQVNKCRESRASQTHSNMANVMGTKDTETIWVGLRGNEGRGKKWGTC